MHGVRQKPGHEAQKNFRLQNEARNEGRDRTSLENPPSSTQLAYLKPGSTSHLKASSVLKILDRRPTTTPAKALCPTNQKPLSTSLQSDCLIDIFAIAVILQDHQVDASALSTRH